MKRIATYRDYVGELTVQYKRTKQLTTKISCSADGETFIRPYFEHCMDDHEEFKIIYLNAAHKVVNVDHVSVGGLTGTLVDVRLVVRNALQITIASVILVHNHPSSNTTPSEADKKLTNKLKKAFELFDIKVLDHLILTRETYLSMADEGLI